MSYFRRAAAVLREEGLASFGRAFATYALKALLLPYFFWKIRRTDAQHGLQGLVDFAFGGCMGLLQPTQVRSEILGLLEIVQGLRPRRVLEVGTANGGTLFLFSRVAARDALLISIDLPGTEPGSGYPRWKSFLYKSFARPGQRNHLIRRDSHDPATLEEVKAVLAGEPVDFLFIDGDHTYEGAKRDFEMYAPLVREGGRIAFHDIATRQPHVACEVPRFWEEVKPGGEHLELVEDRSRQWGGIGILEQEQNPAEMGNPGYTH